MFSRRRTKAADLGVTDPRKSPVNPLVDPRAMAPAAQTLLDSINT